MFNNKKNDSNPPEEPSPEAIFAKLQDSFYAESSDEGESKDISFEEAIKELISAYVSERNGEGSLVSKWAILAEVVDTDDRFMINLVSEDVTPWEYIGMLRSEQSVIELGYASRMNVMSAISHEEDDVEEDDEEQD